MRSAASSSRWAKRIGGAYLIESLFLNSVTYENEKLGAYMRKLTGEE